MKRRLHEGRVSARDDAREQHEEKGQAEGNRRHAEELESPFRRVAPGYPRRTISRGENGVGAGGDVEVPDGGVSMHVIHTARGICAPCRVRRC